MKRWLVGLTVLVLVALGALAAILAFNTSRLKPSETGPEVALAAPVAVDVPGAAARLGQSIRFQTVSHQDPAEDSPDQWLALADWLAQTYPAAHTAMSREVIAGRTLLYAWPGAELALPPILLMAHQDVVPVTPGTEGDWRRPPFGGELAEGAVWGRGAIDDKGSLIGLFEAVEILARQGFRPRRTILILSGHDEETRGEGAKAAAALLKQRGVTAEFVLDEGLLVVADNPLTGGPAALIGLAEKGYATLMVTAPAPGGHSSTPPKETGVATLARAVTAIAEHPAPMKFQGPGAEMVRALAPHADLPVRVAAANSWLFEPLLIDQIAATPSGAALLHTTTAPTMLRGSPKENVLPQDAAAWINYRIAPGDSSAAVMARAKAAVGDLPVQLSWNRAPNEPTPVSSTSSRGWKILAALAADVSKAPVAPGLVVAGTDSRHLQPVAKDVYRFQPIVLSLAETPMIHGTNERMTLTNLERMIQFYARLMRTAAS
jgi:carboxypeptidase PM20D1